MQHVQHIHNLDEVREALVRVFEEVAYVCEQATAAQYVAPSGGKWSIAEHLQHLILSGKPVARGLQLPKLAFMAFGAAHTESRRYEVLAHDYRQLLQQGARATGAYVPDPPEKLPPRERQLAEWRKVGQLFQKNLTKWSEKDLDKYRMPHPLLGKLTVREMLFFTIYHSWHHVEACKSFRI